MNLTTQIISLIFSFSYGVLFSLFLDINHKIIYNPNKLIKYLGSFLVILISTLLYFLILKQINNANVHIYCLIVLSIGFCLYNFIASKLKK